MTLKRSSLFVLPVVVLFFSIAGGFYGPRVQVAAAASQPEELDKDLDGFSKALALVEQNFANPVTADKTIYKGAIPGMLRTLDPHSNFFDPREYQLMMEDQKGHYYGVGMQVAPHSKQAYQNRLRHPDYAYPGQSAAPPQGGCFRMKPPRHIRELKGLEAHDFSAAGTRRGARRW